MLTPQDLRYLLGGGALTPRKLRVFLGGVSSRVLARPPPPRCGGSLPRPGFKFFWNLRIVWHAVACGLTSSGGNGMAKTACTYIIYGGAIDGISPGHVLLLLSSNGPRVDSRFGVTPT